MYNPSRGGVRGGADQFTWESVKNDKHRENYLGHSVMAPVGRWQKGKDLSWYAKERKDPDAQEKADKLEMASIKRAEEEAMLIALGHNVTRKDSQKLSKEEMREALKRNAGERDDRNVERIDGVGASGSSKRLALLSNAASDLRQKQEGVAFESYKDKPSDMTDRNDRENSNEKRKKSKKPKKHKKQKKDKKHNKKSSDSDSYEHILKNKMKHKKSKSDSDSADKKLLRNRNHAKSQHKHRNNSPDDMERSKASFHKETLKRHIKRSNYSSAKRQRHDSSDSD